MWFRISPNKLDRYPANYLLNNRYWLNCDNGWEEIWTVFGFAYIKGYCHERGINGVLANDLFTNPQPRYTGNFIAVLAHNDGHIIITSDTSRSCPIYRDDNAMEVGNMDMAIRKNIWADAWVSLSHVIHEHRWPAVPKVIAPRSWSALVDEVHNLLSAKFSWLGLNGQNIKVFYSGGIDTLTCISYMRAFHIPFELVCAEHSDYDKFTLEFESEIKQHWGYNQIHHYREPTVFVTGACGDEYFLRGPTTANIMLMHLGKSMQEVIKPEHYHYKYFLGFDKSEIYRQQSTDPVILQACKSKTDTADYILRNCINDHQHWHLGNTITFTPLRISKY